MSTLTDTGPLRVPWNKGRLTGQKPPLKLREIWAIRTRLQMASVKRHKVDREIDLKSSHRQIRERAILKNRFLSTRCRIIDVKSSHLAGRLTPSMTTF